MKFPCVKTRRHDGVWGRVGNSSFIVCGHFTPQEFRPQEKLLSSVLVRKIIPPYSGIELGKSRGSFKPHPLLRRCKDMVCRVQTWYVGCASLLDGNAEHRRVQGCITRLGGILVINYAL